MEFRSLVGAGNVILSSNADSILITGIGATTSDISDLAANAISQQILIDTKASNNHNTLVSLTIRGTNPIVVEYVHLTNASANVISTIPQWDDLRVPLTSTTKSGSKIPTFDKFLDDGSGSQGVFADLFSPLTEQEVYFSCQLPHSYLEGSNIEAHVHWAPINANAGNVRWGLEYTWASMTETIANTNIIIVSDNTDGVSKKHHLTSFGYLTGSGQRISSMLLCRLFRDATVDTYASDAAVLEIDFHFQKDSLGSRLIAQK